MLGMDSDGQKCKNSGRLGHCSNDTEEKMEAWMREVAVEVVKSG